MGVLSSCRYSRTVVLHHQEAAYTRGAAEGSSPQRSRTYSRHGDSVGGHARRCVASSHAISNCLHHKHSKTTPQTTLCCRCVRLAAAHAIANTYMGPTPPLAPDAAAVGHGWRHRRAGHAGGCPHPPPAAASAGIPAGRARQRCSGWRLPLHVWCCQAKIAVPALPCAVVAAEQQPRPQYLQQGHNMHQHVRELHGGCACIAAMHHSPQTRASG